MRTLIYSVNFAPDLTGIGKYSGDMAAWLVEQGHEVRVVTAPAYYPNWKLASGRPVIATCDIGTEIEAVVSKCGLVVPPEDSAALAGAICELADKLE
jgi:colanic acid biosynthesis glycosyl transferase WcaI